MGKSNCDSIRQKFLPKKATKNWEGESYSYAASIYWQSGISLSLVFLKQKKKLIILDVKCSPYTGELATSLSASFRGMHADLKMYTKRNC